MPIFIIGFIIGHLTSTRVEHWVYAKKILIIKNFLTSTAIKWSSIAIFDQKLTIWRTANVFKKQIEVKNKSFGSNQVVLSCMLYLHSSYYFKKVWVPTSDLFCAMSQKIFKIFFKFVSQMLLIKSEE